MLNIDNKQIQIGGAINTDNFLNKSDIVYAFNGYGDSATKVTFKKKGSDIKQLLMGRLSRLQSKMNMCETKAEALKKDMMEHQNIKANWQTSEEASDKDYMDYGMRNPLSMDIVDGLSEELKRTYRQYKDMLWKIKHTNEDIKAINAIASNLEDGKEYTLNLKQIMAISKSYSEEVLNKLSIEESEYLDNGMRLFHKGELEIDDHKVTEPIIAVEYLIRKSEIDKPLAETIRNFFPYCTLGICKSMNSEYSKMSKEMLQGKYDDLVKQMNSAKTDDEKQEVQRQMDEIKEFQGKTENDEAHERAANDVKKAFDELGVEFE